MISIQKFSTIPIKIDYTTKSNNRARLNTGMLCNYKCEFCYYKHSLDKRDSLETIIHRIDDIVAFGITEIDLSGGESSFEPNWFKILEYCNDKFTNISTLSNGSKFSDIEFLKKSKEYGLKEILFSLHGSNESIHDKITGIKGSFKKILKAIENAKVLDIVVRINCSVYDLNHDSLRDEYIHLLKKIIPLEINFITLRYDTDNNDFRKNNYLEITDSIKFCIDNIKDSIKYINVRYTPYCYMIGYEKYVCNYYQHIYDIYDWNLAVYNHSVNTKKKYTNKEKLHLAYDAAKNFRISSYTKHESCKLCKYFFICDGVEKQLKETPLQYVTGTKIFDVNYFREGFYD